jgi:NADH:ubiquinone oxidoreductase subunit F (NADH-binding)
LKKTTRHKEASVPERLVEAGGLTRHAAEAVSKETGVPAADVYGVASFFDLLARPAHTIRVCQGLSCWMNESAQRLKEAQDAGLPAEGCSCLAACDRPVAVLRGREVLPVLVGDDVQRAGGQWEALTSATYDADRWPGALGAVPAESSAGPGLAMDLAGSCDFSGAAFRRAQEMGVDAVLTELDASGLQGRGGAGFPAATKWHSVRSQAETHRYVVLNADESEPGTFKDRDLLLHRPDLVLEGLAIAAWAIDADEVYRCLRGEFSLPRRKVADAIERFGDTFGSIRFHIHDGHGAYICGEETAMLEALEGRRGMPRLKPPYPTENGLWGKPTLIHNVETIACVNGIVRHGGAWFMALGRTGAGTKLYSISGHVQEPGTYELPLGVTLDELVHVAGGYVGELMAFSPGGASAGFLPASERALPLDWKSLYDAGSGLGSAGVVVLNDTVDIVDAVRQTLRFFELESCGQCAPCRIGTRSLREAIDAFRNGAEPAILRHVDEVSWEMTEGSICGLGYAAPIPLLTALKHFPKAFGR